MAGAGIRLFTAGEILTADLVNTYLMDQVVPRFASTTTRNASFGGAGQPTLGASDEGRLCYLDSTNELQYWNGSTWVSIGDQAVIGIIAAKGDLIVGTTANTITNLSVGANGKVLTADSGTGTGLAWSSPTVDDLAITSAKIANLTIVDGNISASAAISLSKLATGALPTAITVTSANISDLSIVNADVSTSAAIAYSKLNLGTSIVNADIATGAAIAASKISGTAITAADTGTVTSTMIADGTIVNADVSASAAIAHTKLAAATAGQVLLGTTTTGVVTATTVSGDVTITGAGVTAISSGVIVDADVSATAAISRGKIADMSIDTKTGNYTLVLTDANKLIEMNLTSTANTVSVPTNASVAFPIGTQINITQYGTGKTQIVAVTSGTTSIRSTPGSYLRDRYSSATLIKRATDEWYLIGDLSAS